MVTHRFDPVDAPGLLRAARADGGLTQADLARRSGIAQPNIAAIESGRRSVSPETLEQLLRAADYRPATALLRAREGLLSEMGEYGVTGILVFGSASRGQDGFDSDLDLILDTDPDADPLEALALVPRIEELTGFPVDGHLRSSAEKSEFGRRMIAEAVWL